MLRYLKAPARLMTYPARAARRRPWVTLAVICLALITAAGGGVWYVGHQWRAAQTALAEGRPSDARSRLDVCLLVWPRDPEVHLLAARAARMMNDLQAAEAHLNQCLKLHGGATQAVQLEFLLLRVHGGELEEVAPTLIESVEKGNPDSPLILETLAGAYIHRFRYKAAYACLTRWIELRPDVAKPYQWRGWVLERMNHHKVAMTDYERALELDPDLLPVRLRVAEMWLEDSQPLKALPHLQMLMERFPGRPEVLARLGQCRLLQGQSQEARRLLEAAVAQLPNDPVVLLHLGKLDVQDGRLDDAEQRLRRAVKADPSDTESYYTLTRCLSLQGRKQEAADTLVLYKKHKAVLDRANQLLRDEDQLSSKDPKAPSEVGTLLLTMGHERQGLYWLDQALERDPNHQPTHKALAEHFERKGDRERAGYHRRRLTEPGQKPSGS